MKNISKYMFGALLGAGLVACSPETFDGISEGAIPTVSTYDGNVNITVDQSINQVTFSLANAQGVYPIWTVNTGKKTETFTNNDAKRIYTIAGDYEVTVQIGNRNGISDGSIKKTFHIDNSIVDFTPYITKLAKNPWFIDNTAKGHLGCGEPGTDGTNWWSADPDAKKAEGVYENSLTFGEDMKYTFDPGKSGTMYVNTGCTIYPEYNIIKGDDGNLVDFTVPVELQESTYNLEMDGEDLYLTFPKGTYFPYIANDDIWNTPRYRVLNLTTKAMELLIDNGSISWHYLLTTSHEVAFEGFTYDQADNIWKQATVEAGGIFYADGNWAPYPDDGGATFNVSNQEVNITLPLATSAQWQAQFPLVTNIGPGSPLMNSATTYDFSCVVNSNKDLGGMTFKLVETGANGVPGSLGINYDSNAVFAETRTIPGGEDYVFFLTDLKGIDVQDNLLQLMLDFGGNSEGTEVTIKNIVLIEHDKNTELGNLPNNDDPGSEPAVMDWNSDSAANLWKAVETGDALISVTPWFSPAGWSGGLNPDWSHESGVWTVTIPEGIGPDQWMGQFPINTSLTASAEKKYNFYCVVEADNDCPGVTIKLTQTDESPEVKHDKNCFFADRHDIEMSVPFIYKATEVTLPEGDAHALSLFFDFGGCQAGTNVKISDIYFEEVKEINYDDPNNLWKAVDAGDAMISVTPWFSPAGWSGGLTPDWNHDPGSDTWTLTLPEGMGPEQWMGQFPINTNIAASAEDSYSFAVTLETDNDCPGVTIKLTQTDESPEVKHDDNFFFQDRHDVTAFEEFNYKVTGAKLSKGDAHALSLFFDFGGCPVGTNVTIKKITLIKD